MTTKSSASDFGRDHGLIHEAVVTGRKAEWTANEWSKLAHSEETMRDFRKVLLGHAEIVTPKHVIDCDADPFNPWAKDGWTVEEHRKGGVFKWNAEAVALHLDNDQQNGKMIEGNKLRKELANKPVLNANVLDYLLVHPHLIPEEWKKDGKGNTHYIFFWGTIYRDRDGYLFVRYLYWVDGGWRWSNGWLNCVWRGDYPAAVPAS